MRKYEFIEHTSEIKIKSYGKNIEEVFENFALAVSQFLSRGKKIKSVKKKTFKVSGKDFEELLYSFIEEIIYFLDAENFIISKAKIKIMEKKQKKLRVTIFGDSSKKYKDLDHIKAPTYSEMYIKNFGKNKGWEAQTVLDV